MPVKLKHQPPAKYRKEKKSLICFFFWQGMLHVDKGHKLLEPTLDLLSAACPLIKTGDKIDFQNWVIFIHKSKQDAVPSTSPTEYCGTYITYQNDPLSFLAMPDRRQTRNGQILLHVFAPAKSRKGLLSFWWSVLCKYSVRLISFILLHPFISFHIILVKNPCADRLYNYQLLFPWTSVTFTYHPVISKNEPIIAW